MKQLTSMVMCSIIAILVGLPMASVWAEDSFRDSSSGNLSTVKSAAVLDRLQTTQSIHLAPGTSQIVTCGKEGE